MPQPGPVAARMLVALALTTTGGAWLRAAVDLAGGAPRITLAAAALLPAALAASALFALISTTLLSPARRRARLALLILPALGMALAPTLADLSGRLIGDSRPWTVLAALVVVVLSLPLAAVAAAAWRPLPAAPAADALGVAAGAVLATLVPPGVAGVLAALALALGARAAAPALAPLPDDLRLLRVAGIATAAAGLAWCWVGLRGLVDPSPVGAMLFFSAAGVAATVARAFGPRGADAALAIGATAPLAAHVALWKGPGLARMAVLEGIADGHLVPAGLLGAAPLLVSGAGLGLLLGLAWGPRPLAPAAWLGLALGLPLVGLPGAWAPAWLAGLIGATAPVWSLRRGVQAGGLALALAALSVAWVGGRPDPTVLATASWPLLRGAQAAAVDAESRASTTTLLAAVDLDGASLLRVPTERWDETQARARPGVRLPRLLELDGLVAESVGRAAEAETLAGHLVGLLAPRRERVLVLGDHLARALGGLVQHPIGALIVSTPAPATVRAMAAADPQLGGLWLDPRVTLTAAAPGALLLNTPPQDAIIEVVRAPWADATHQAPTPTHLDRVAARLAPDGLYVLVLHLGWMEPGQPAAIAAALAARFPHVQAWLPPFGADSLILVAGSAPPPLDRLVERLQATPALLSELDVALPEDLASLAVSDGPGLQEWHGQGGGALPSPLALSGARFARPVLHLADLAAHLAPPESVWTLADQDARQRLEIRAQARRSFLRLLGEASTGDMEAVFQRARELQEAGGGLGAAALEPLIEPHVQDAQRAMVRAQAEGLASPAWDDAMRYATTARMLAPTSPRPLVLLGEISLGRGKVTHADEAFQQALSLDPDHVPALTGQARAARARGDDPRAEQLLQQATQAAGQDWRTWQNLGVFLMEKARLPEAETALRTAVQRSDGRQAPAHLALAELMLRDGRPAAALLTAERALELVDSGHAWYLRGRAHYDMGEAARAEEDFRRAVLLSPDLYEARAGIGLILAERGELEQAAEAWRAVVRLAPDNRVARETLRRIEEDIAAEEARGAPP